MVEEIGKLSGIRNIVKELIPDEKEQFADCSVISSDKAHAAKIIRIETKNGLDFQRRNPGDAPRCLVRPAGMTIKILVHAQ